MKVVLFISVWIISTVAYDKKISGTGCGTVLSSVRMEVSPTLLQIICSNNNQTTLVVDCGSSIWYEKVTGFCNSFDLNIGQALMDQSLLSSTITLQLVKSGQILDAAKVAILTSEHLFHYRISVWGNRNTRFVIGIEKSCNPFQRNDISGTLDRDELSSSGKASRHVPLVHVNSLLPGSVYNTENSLSQTYPSDVTGDEAHRVPEYLRPNKLAIVEHNNYAFLKMQKLLTGSKGESRFGDRQTKMDIYRIKVSKPESAVGREHLHQYDEDDSEDDFMTTTPESSELAKLRWMEEKRILFEQRMKFLRNFYPESEDTTENESPTLDDTEDRTDAGFVNLTATANKLPTGNVNEPVSSPDPFRQGEDATNMRNTETRSRDHDHEQFRKSENLQLNRKYTHNEEHKRLEYRQLSNSDSSLDRNNGTKVEFVQVLHPSDQSILINSILPTALTQEAILKKNNKSFTSTDNNDNVFGKVDASHVSNSWLETFQKLTIGENLPSVLKEPLKQNRKSTNNIGMLSESDKGIAQSTRSSEPSMVSSTVANIIHATKITRSSHHSQGIADTTSGDRLNKNSYLHKVIEEGMDNSKPTIAMNNITPAVSLAASRFLHKLTSQLQSEFQQNLRFSANDAIKENLVQDINPAPNLRSSTSPQLPTEGSNVLSSSTSAMLDNHIQNMSEHITREQDALFTSPLMNSSTKLEKVKDNISLSSAVSRTPTRPSAPAPTEHNHPDPDTSPTSQSFPHSAPLQLKSSRRREPSIEYELSYVVDKTASPASTAAQSRPADKHSILETATSETTRAPQQKANNTHLLQKAKTKAAKTMNKIQPVMIFSNNTTQLSTTSSHGTTNIPSVILKRDSHVSPIILEEVNNSTAASVQLVVTVTEPATTTESFEQGTTSPLQTNTGTSQGGENEPQEMGEDSFWPVVAALVIGIPAIVVLVIAITVIHKKRLEDPARQACLQVIQATASASPSR